MEHPAYTLSALSFVGGTMGYLRKKSIPSLVAGVGISIIYGTAGYLLHKNADWGLELALTGSTLMLAGGISRGIPVKFTKPVPIMLTSLGLLSGAYYGNKYYQFYG